VSKSFGSAKLKGEYWHVTLEPQAMITFKRIFARVDKAEMGTVKLLDNDDSCRNLLWFSERYPINIAPLAHLLRRAESHRKTEQFISAVTSDEGYEPPSFGLALPARHYQRLAADVLLRKGHLLLADDVGLGKAQPLSCGVLTPSGWRRMGDLKVGDPVTDPDGGVAWVEGVYPQGVKQVYKLVTGDGASTRCCDEHLWLLHTANDRRRGGVRVLPLSGFRDRLFRVTSGQRVNNYFLPLPAPIDYGLMPDVLPLDPYLVGALLGDGGLTSGGVIFTKDDEWVVEQVRRSLPCGVVMQPADRCSWRLSRKATSGHNPVKDALRRLGVDGKLSWQKSIPVVYQRANPMFRVMLLHGLMDTDGDCSASGTSIYNTSSPALADDVVELVRGLGGIASVSIKENPMYAYKGERRTGRTAYRVNVRLPFNPFLVPRKAERWHKPYMARAIDDVMPDGVEETRCIKVSSARGIYITDGYIVTHNTASSICALTDPRTLPALVVTLTHLPQQWADEIKKFMPRLHVHIVDGGKPYPLNRPKGSRGNQLVLVSSFPDVIVMNYHKLAGWAETLAPMVKSIIFDEIQELRTGPGTAKYEAAKHISDRVDFRCGLSATPIFNFGGEIWNVLDVLAPGELGTEHEFRREWCVSGGGMNDKPKLGDPKAFGHYARDAGLMLRRTRAEVGRELPPLSVVPHLIEYDEAALSKVSASVAELAKIILSQGGMGIDKLRASEELSWKLRQATGIDKAPYVADFVRLLVESGEQVVLYGWHREVYHIWLDRMADLKPALFTGTESTSQKQEAKRRFLAKETPVLIMSLRAGAGVDGLQHVCKTVVYGELDWSPGVHEQGVGRVFRDGQKDPVSAYFLIADHGSDPVVADVVNLKKLQIDGLRDPDRPLVETAAPGDAVRRLAEEFLKGKSATLINSVVGGVK